MWFSCYCYCYCYCYFCHWPSFTWFSSSPRQPVDFGLSLELSFRDIFPPPTTFSTFFIWKWECEHGVPLNNDYFNLLVGNLFINKVGFCKPGWIFFQNNVCLFISFLFDIIIWLDFMPLDILFLYGISSCGRGCDACNLLTLMYYTSHLFSSSHLTPSPSPPSTSSSSFSGFWCP